MNKLDEFFVPLNAAKRKLVNDKKSSIDKELKKPFVGKERKNKLGNLRKNIDTALVHSDLEKREREVINKKMTDEPRNNIRSLTREDLDCLLDYLLDEGYVTDVKSGIKIIDCMSEEWVDDILDEKFVSGKKKESP